MLEGASLWALVLRILNLSNLPLQTQMFPYLYMWYRHRQYTGKLGYDGLNGTRKIGPSYAKSVVYIWRILDMHRTGTKHFVRICKNLSFSGPSYPSSPVYCPYFPEHYPQFQSVLDSPFQCPINGVTKDKIAWSVQAPSGHGSLPQSVGCG